MWTKPGDDRPRTSQDAEPRPVVHRRFRTSTGQNMRMRLVPAVLALAVAGSMVAADSVRAQSPADDGATKPGLCLEAASSFMEPGTWNEILGAATEAAEGNADFFPDAVVVSIPDLTQPWDPEAFPTVKIGIWGTGGSDPGSTADWLERLAGADCLSDDLDWSTTISHGLVLAAAERMLAGARLPQPDGELLISEDVKADIDVEFHPAEQLVRTVLDWSKPAFIVDVGGSCWIDDVLGAETGAVVVSTEAAKDVTPVVGDAGCVKFQEFLGETGAGERAIDLLPTEFSLADGIAARFVVESVEVHDAEIVMAGSLETR